jgi:reactive intermediate/imine deaminase
MGLPAGLYLALVDLGDMANYPRQRSVGLEERAMAHQIIGGELKLADGKALPLSKGVRAGEFVLLSGQLGLDASGKLSGEDIESQTLQALANIQEILKQAGCTLDQVIKATVWLTRREDFARFNTVYATHFPAAPPVRSTVVSELVLPGALVEIEVMAYAP